MTIAEETRQAVRRHPFLLDALNAGVVNYTAAARYLDIGDEEAVAAALRRFAADRPVSDRDTRDVRIRVRRGVGPCSGDIETPLLVVGDERFGEGGELTAISVTGSLDPWYIACVSMHVGIADISLHGWGWIGDEWVLITDSAGTADVIRILEETVAPVPD